MYRSGALGIWSLEVLECGVDGREFLWFTCLRERFQWRRAITTFGSRGFLCGSRLCCIDTVKA